jgi:hypothetical protein
MTNAQQQDIPVRMLGHETISFSVPPTQLAVKRTLPFGLVSGVKTQSEGERFHVVLKCYFHQSVNGFIGEWFANQCYDATRCLDQQRIALIS